MPVSRRVAGVKAIQLAELFRLAEKVGATDIALGLPTGVPPRPVLDATLAALASGAFQYADPVGLAPLRAAVAELLHASRGVSVDPERELTITCGATEGVFAALLATTDPGDEVLLFEPYFELYPGMVRLAGAVPVPVPLSRPDWRLDETALRACVSPRTRAVVLNTPHNPSGHVFDEAEVRLILDLCATAGLTCVTDEVYEHFTFDGRPHVSPLDLAGTAAPAVVVSSFSKTLEISGWRIGYCVAAPETTSALRRAHEHLTLGTSRPLQAGAAALPAFDVLAPALATRRERIERQRNLMTDRLSALGLPVHRPDGGWFLLASTAKLDRSAAALAHELVEEAGVLVAPGTPFFSRAADGDQWIRTTFVRDPEATAGALDRFARYLD